MFSGHDRNLIYPLDWRREMRRRETRLREQPNKTQKRKITDLVRHSRATFPRITGRGKGLMAGFFIEVTIQQRSHRTGLCLEFGEVVKKKMYKE